jgi:hypothetical protein
MSQTFRLERANGVLRIGGDFGLQDVRKVFAALHDAVTIRGHQDITLDFTACSLAFSGAMLPICAQVMMLREKGIDFDIVLPEYDRTYRLFLNTGWAHLLSPEQYGPTDRSRFDRQFPAAQYKTHDEQEVLLNELLDKLLAVVPNFNRAAFAAVEWALNEISDNVLNHSQSPIGGLLQLSVFDARRHRVEFTVADAGLGVPRTLRAAKHEIKTDTDALLASVKSGVTRNSVDFQGNGLYGTHEICRAGGGKFSINAGNGVLFTTAQTTTSRNEPVPFCGTTVDALIDFSEPSLLERSLAIDGSIHRPVDYIELRYEQDDLKFVPFKLLDQAPSFRSRPAGRPARTKLSNLVVACAGQTILVDFSGVTVVSSSFADEVFGKLFLELGPMRFMQSIRMVNVAPTVQALIDRAITQRMQSPAAPLADEGAT